MADEAGRKSGEAAAALARLRAAVQPTRRAVVAFSGGTDSSLVAWAAADTLGQGALAVIGISPSLSVAELDNARRVARTIGVRYREVETRELDNASYRANAGDRCYHCKAELFSRLESVRAAEGYEVVLDGSNVDDLGDTRPGMTAARERHVASPLVAAGLGKALVRQVSRLVGLPTWDRPQNACLASRLPVGVAVSRERLQRVERAEAALRELGFRVLRVRDEGEGDRARVELGAAEIAAARSSPAVAASIESAVRAAGFGNCVIDPNGYRQGGADRRPGT